MFRDLFSNLSIVVSFLMLIGLFFKNNTFENKQSLKNQIIFGFTFGVLGIVLMMYTIHMTDTVILDLRNISILCAGIIGGSIATMLAAVMIAIFRVLYFGLNHTSMVAVIVVLTTGVGVAYLCRVKISLRFKFICMFFLTMISYTMALIYLLKFSPKLGESLFWFWAIHMIGAIFAYLTCEFIKSNNINYKTMSYYKMTADNLSDVISTHKSGGEVLFVSAPLYRMFGYTPEEFVGTSSYEYIHPKDVDTIREAFNNPSKGQTPMIQTLRMKHKNGSYIWVEITIKNIWNIDGSLKEMICVTRDISHRKKIEQQLEISNQRLKAIFENAGIGIVLRDIEGHLIDANPTYIEMMGYTKEEMYDLLTILDPDDFENVSKVVYDLENGITSLNKSDVRYVNKKQQEINAEVISSYIPGTEHTPPSIVRIVNNITERRRMELSLRDSEERFRTAFNNAVIGMCLSSPEGKFLKINQALCSLLGYEKEELLSMNFRQVTHPDYLEEEIRLRNEITKGNLSNFVLEKSFIRKDSSVVWAILGVSGVYDANNKLMHYIGQVQDITTRKQAEEELNKAKLEAEKLAFIDPLTGIFNRRAFEEQFMAELQRSILEKLPISLILTDIDYFKNVNDTYGHKVGDIVLKCFTDCLSQVIRPQDILSRHGGEEFIICMPDTDNSKAMQIAEDMRKAVELLLINIENNNETVHITASFGVVTTVPTSIKINSALMIQVDRVMYKAKEQGRNRVCSSVLEG